MQRKFMNFLIVPISGRQRRIRAFVAIKMRAPRVRCKDYCSIGSFDGIAVGFILCFALPSVLTDGLRDLKEVALAT